MKQSRNAPCSCGSGKKYKACCASQPRKKSGWIAGLALVAFVLVTVFAVASAVRDVDRPPPEGMVWDPEHGHYHSTDTNDPNHPPSPDHYWDEEHGHWHDPASPDHQ